MPAGLSAIDGVGQDVSQCLAHAHLVDDHVREVSGCLQRQFNLSSLRLWLPAIYLCGEQLVNRTRFEREPQLTMVGPRKPVQISYETT